ncbi:MAG: hypothetical protein KDD05_09985, partial [Psychroserpens sp.]|nr:hypothetical protein [Psychroserpens sp.]
TLRWTINKLRFSNYSLVINEYSHFEEEDIKSVKHYYPGETVTFHSAKSYYSIHVDHTYYLIGTDTLDTGEIVDFEYCFSAGSPETLFRN